MESLIEEAANDPPGRGAGRQQNCQRRILAHQHRPRFLRHESQSTTHIEPRVGKRSLRYSLLRNFAGDPAPRLVAPRSLLPPIRGRHRCRSIPPLRSYFVALLCGMAQRLCVSAETSSAGPAPKASRSALSASSAPGRHPYRSIPQRCSSSCFSLRYGSASLRLRGGTEATAHVSASMNQDVSLRLGSAVKRGCHTRFCLHERGRRLRSGSAVERKPPHTFLPL